MKALILAAGYGTRLRPYTSHTPKPLFTIAGRPLLGVIIDKLQQAGCKSIIINTHHLHHDIEAFVAAGRLPILSLMLTCMTFTRPIAVIIPRPPLCFVMIPHLTLSP